MPLDKAGNFHLNTQRMMASEKKQTGISGKQARGAQAIEHQAEPEAPGMGGGKAHSITDNGDGTFRSVSHDGEEMDHPTAAHAAMHFMGKHADEGKHLLASSDGFGHTSHQVEPGGQVEAHDHDNIEALKEHMGQFLDEEAAENSPHGAAGMGGEY